MQKDIFENLDVSVKSRKLWYGFSFTKSMFYLWSELFFGFLVGLPIPRYTSFLSIPLPGIFARQILSARVGLSPRSSLSPSPPLWEGGSQSLNKQTRLRRRRLPLLFFELSCLAEQRRRRRRRRVLSSPSFPPFLHGSRRSLNKKIFVDAVCTMHFQSYIFW